MRTKKLALFYPRAWPFFLIVARKNLNILIARSYTKIDKAFSTQSMKLQSDYRKCASAKEVVINLIQ